MYNQEIKERFLVENIGEKNEKSCRAKFDDIGVYELEINKDFSEMSIEEAKRAMQEAHVATYGSAFALLSQLRNYVKWCKANTAFSCVNEDLISLEVGDISVSEDMKQTVFKDEQDLIKELISVRTFDDGYYDVIVMVFSWLGITQNKLLNVKINDVDFENMIIFCDGEQIQFSESIKDILLRYSKTKRSTRMYKNGLREVFRDDSYDCFIRKFSAPKQLGKVLTKSQIQDSVYDLNASYMDLGHKSRFTISNVYTSGALHRVAQLERSGVDVFLMKNKNAVSGAFGDGSALHEILWLYKNYKAAFNV